MQQSHDAVVPGEAGSHHKDAHSTDERGDVAHVGEAVPGTDVDEGLILSAIFLSDYI